MFKLQIFKDKKLFKEYKIGETLNKKNVVKIFENNKEEPGEVYDLTKEKIDNALGYNLNSKIIDNKYLKIFNNKKWNHNLFLNPVSLNNGSYNIKIENETTKHYACLYKKDGTLINRVNIVTDTNSNNYYHNFRILKISENAVWILYDFYNGSEYDAFWEAEQKKTNWGDGSATYAFCPSGGSFFKPAYINTSGILALGSQYTYIATDNAKFNTESNPNPVYHEAYLINDFWNLDSFVLLRKNSTFSKYTDPNKDIGLNWYVSSITSDMQEYTVNRETGAISSVGSAVGLGTEYINTYNSNNVYVSGIKNKTDSVYSYKTCYIYKIRIDEQYIYIEKTKHEDNNRNIDYILPIIFRNDQTYANDADMTPTSYINYQYSLIGYNATLNAGAAPVALKIETGNRKTNIYTRLIIQDMPESDSSTWVSWTFDPQLKILKSIINIIYINNRAYFLLLDKSINLDPKNDKKLQYRSDWYDYYFDLYTIDIPTKKIVYAGKISEILEREAPWAL